MKSVSLLASILDAGDCYRSLKTVVFVVNFHLSSATEKRWHMTRCTACKYC